MLIVKHADHAIFLNEYQPCVRDKAMQIGDWWREAADRELAARSGRRRWKFTPADRMSGRTPHSQEAVHGLRELIT